ncbi:hypothetical protein [Lactobacillus kitasatonis]|uniref:hypothetical protein n=1 Tax=Lactobacillus kitasatonis TaxID=237446 RepID=UPI0026E96B10|nr:hypothetical protein [Lactobacillus kitasatonis]
MQKRIIAFVSVIVVVVAAIVGFNVYRSSQRSASENTSTNSNSNAKVKKNGTVTSKGKIARF